jgi:hypothetical protein
MGRVAGELMIKAKAGLLSWRLQAASPAEAHQNNAPYSGDTTWSIEALASADKFAIIN